MTARRRPAAQGALFGPEEPIPAPRRPGRSRPTVNDLDLIESVVWTARDPGYVLIGAAGRVYRRCADNTGEVERVPGYEDAAVHQLIDQGHFTIGGGHPVRYGRYEGRANSVLVSKATRQMANRWRAYRRPPS